MDPEELVDEHGGVLILAPPVHKCVLPDLWNTETGKKYKNVVAYKTGCCGTLWRIRHGEWGDGYWRKASRFYLRRLKKKGIDVMDSYPGQHAFEDLMSRSDPTPSGQVYLVDLAAELHINEADLGFFAWSHLSDEDYAVDAGTVSVDGAETLRTFLSKEV